MRRLLALAVVAALGCGARSEVDPNAIADSSGAGATGPFGVTVANGSATGAGGAPGASSGSGGSSPSECTPGTPGDPLSSACGAYACVLDGAGDPVCAACLNAAVASTCAFEIHKATTKEKCLDASACARNCDPPGACACVEGCMAGAREKCSEIWAAAFWCLSGACRADCGAP